MTPEVQECMGTLDPRSRQLTAHFAKHPLPIDQLPDYIQRAASGQTHATVVQRQSAASFFVYRRFNFPLLFWKRVGNDPKEWKGPHAKGWLDPATVYDFKKYRPEKHNVGVFTGRAIAPGKYLTDVDFDKLNILFVKAFFPPSDFGVTRPGKELSHVFYTTPTPFEGKKEYEALSDDKPYIELRGTKSQTMLPPSLHTPPDTYVQLRASSTIAHVDLLTLEMATLDYAIASLATEGFPSGLHHAIRNALAGYLLKRKFDDKRVLNILLAICEYQVQCRVPDMSDYDIKDCRDNVASTVAKLKNKEKVSGRTFLLDVNADFLARLQKFLPRYEGPVSLEDFFAYMPDHTYMFLPSREFWPASSVNARIPPIPSGTDDNGKPKTIPANVWLDWHRPVEQAVWAPGLPLQIQDRLIDRGGWINRAGCSCVNLYRPPQIALGDASEVGPWLDHVRLVYPEDAGHIIAWLAHRVQKPSEKINHALVLGGVPGIGKDSIIEPVKTAVGPWNFAEIGPPALFEPFNPFVKSVILRISEAHDLGEVNRYSFYERMKTYTAAPPDVIDCNDKFLRKHSVSNVCGVVITTNHETDGMFLPRDDRRHYVTWSTKTPADFPEGYWNTLHGWYDHEGGRGHVAAYLASYDLTKFDPKGQPEKTAAFWAIVDANRPIEDAELSDVLDALDNPPAITLKLLGDACPSESLRNWLSDRKNSRQIPHRMKTADYVPIRNEAATDGLWKMDGKRQVVYVKQSLSVHERRAAVEVLIANAPAAKAVRESDLPL